MAEITLGTAAAMAMDLFYQDYAPRDAFFDQTDFKRHFAAVYADMLNTMAGQVRKENRQLEGFGNLENSANWLIREKLTPKKSENGCWVAKPSNCIFNFMYDSFGYGLDQITSAGNCASGGGCRVIRITPQEALNIDIAPISSVIYAWLAPDNEIQLSNRVDIDIWYIPEVDSEDENCHISAAIVHRVIRQVLDLFFVARNGTVIDETNDGNRNSVLGQQLNPTLNKPSA
jgi:hypothetical protein